MISLNTTQLLQMDIALFEFVLLMSMTSYMHVVFSIQETVWGDMTMIDHKHVCLPWRLATTVFTTSQHLQTSLNFVNKNSLPTVPSSVV